MKIMPGLCTMKSLTINMTDSQLRATLNSIELSYSHLIVQGGVYLDTKFMAWVLCGCDWVHSHTWLHFFTPKL